MLLDVYVHLYKSLREPRAALTLCVEIAALGIAHMLRRGIDPEVAFRSMGLRFSDVRPGKRPWNIPWQVQTMIREGFREETIHGPGMIREHPIYRIILDPDTVSGVPDPDCMIRHLPRDREPTDEEIRRAWEACRQ